MNILPAHGVLICMKNIGVFLIGKSGIGKSEIALQLIHQGAILICDDAPDLTADHDSGGLRGSCPEKFQGLMHLRDIGIINIIELLGQQYFKKKHSVNLIIELIQPSQNEILVSDLNPNYKIWHYKDKEHQQSWNIPGIGIHLYPNRNIPLLIQAAVAQFALLEEPLAHIKGLKKQL